MFGNELVLTTVLVAGFLSFFAPCTFPLIPVYIGMLGDEDGEYKKLRLFKREFNIGGFIKTIAFILGLSTSFVALGIGAGFLGSFISDSRVVFFAGLLVVILGIHQMGIIHIKKLDMLGGFQFENNKTKALGSYLTGVSFSLGWTPCATPVLGAILTLSIGEGRVIYGGLLMLVYTLGLSIPFIIMMIATKFMMGHFSFLKKHTLTLKRFGGFLVVVMGLVLMSNKLANLTAIFENIIHLG